VADAAAAEVEAAKAVEAVAAEVAKAVEAAAAEAAKAVALEAVGAEVAKVVDAVDAVVLALSSRVDNRRIKEDIKGSNSTNKAGEDNLRFYLCERDSCRARVSSSQT
jgi:hypothetical protein